MSSKRRHGADFTDSLNSFRQTFHCHGESTCSTFKPFSHDSLDVSSNNSRSITTDSIILSGNFVPKAAGHASLLRDASEVCRNIDKESYQMSEAIIEPGTPSDAPLNEDCNMLNTAYCMSFETQDTDKSVSSIHNNDMNSDHDTEPVVNKENICHNQVKDLGKSVMSAGTSIATRPSIDENIDDVQCRLILHVEQPVYDNDDSMLDAKDHDMSIVHETNVDLNRTPHYSFAEVCSHMINELNATKSFTCSKDIFQQCSANFTASPKNFTERLITIIEESIVNSDSGIGKNSAVNLSRLTKEFRSMCKFIEDEPVPQWPLSPIASCSYNLEDTAVSNMSLYRTGEHEGSAELFKTPFVQNDSFEVLEAQCKIMCAKEDEKHQPDSAMSLQPVVGNNLPDMSMKKYLLLSEQQMASLDESDCGNAIMQNCAGIQSSQNIIHRSPKKLQTLQQQLMKKQFEQRNHSNKNNSKSALMSTSQSPAVAGGRTSSTPLRLSFKKDVVPRICGNSPSLHELEESVLLGIAEKRQRCFDTAVAMMELNSNGKNADTEGMERLLELNAYCKDNSLENSSKEFLNTLISCTKYLHYLDKHKTLINQIRSKGFSLDEFDCSHSNVETSEQESVANIATKLKECSDRKEGHQSQTVAQKFFSTPVRSPLKQNLPTSQEQTSRPKLFTTPGKSVVNSYQRRNHILFPNVCKAPSFKQSRYDNVKTSHRKRLYGFDYDSVISPVGMYIKGTDVQLIQNVQSKTNDMLLTPSKTPRKNSTQQSQSKALMNFQETALKFRLSSRSPMKPCQDTNSKNCGMNLSPRKGNQISDNHLTLPKVVYTLPAQVRTETRQGTAKKWVKGLLATAQSKVVIRHEERVGSAERKKKAGTGDGVQEILHGSMNESIHVENIATKTNFISRKKV